MANRNFKIMPKCVSADPSATYPLSPEQLQFYHDNGYLVIKKLIGIPALNSYRQRFTDVCEGRVEKGRVTVVKDRALCKNQAKAEDFINKIQELLYDEVYSTYSEDPRLLHIVSQLVGQNLTAINCMLINKPPGTREHPPHQDLLYFPFRPANKIVATWTAIDPVNADNGCLYMVPGSHKHDVLFEHRDQVNEAKLFFYGLAEDKRIAPEHKRVYLDMEPGDTVFFVSTIVHGSRPNVSNSYRKAMTCHYASSECRYIDVTGTAQEGIAAHMEAELRRRGGDLSYVDIMRIKTKQVRGVRCNL
ncbi:probable phytanoyl-CoA dioxygenase [Spodoptera frugiperda]|uniref:phytanoyl-CoA dioxygenase n=1 Tax=Spodoptera frugiperda TaxID=7108 RepID=A0A9R0EX60_SPOFR|nr:probable phytanoyl-CoA dioxygenase [Spodoptera frugiperda]